MKTKERNSPRATELRRLVLENPEWSVEDLRNAWKTNKKLGPFPAKKKALDNFLYSTKYTLRKRWGVTNLKELKELPMIAWAKKVLTLHPDWVGSFEKVKNLLAQDGIPMSEATFAVAKAAWKKEYPGIAAKLAASESPDPNQLAGPRKGKRRKSKAHRVESADQAKRAGDFYVSVEDELDKLIRDADTIRDSKLAAALRASRRIASAKILQLV